MNSTRVPAKTIRFALRRQSGLTLVELMVAIALGLFLSWGAIKAFLTGKQNYTTQQALSRIQENARTAQELMGYDIRSSGSYGCASGKNVGTYTERPISAADYATGVRSAPIKYVWVNGLTGTSHTPILGESNPTAERNFAAATFAVNNVSGAANADTTLLANLNPAPLAGTDVLITHNAENLGAYVLSGSTKTQLTVPNRNFLQTDLLALTDANCRQLFIFQPTVPVTTAGGNNVVTYTTPSPTLAGFPDPVWGGKNLWDAGATLMRLSSTIYYIANNAAGVPSLYRRVWNGTPAVPVGASDELLNGVENLQIDVGIDTNNDGVVDTYATPNAVTAAQWNAWNDSNQDGDIQEGDRVLPDVSPHVEQNVVAIRYSLLLRSEDQLLETPQAYTYNGVITTPPATDRRLRQVVTGTISIRSRLN